MKQVPEETKKVATMSAEKQIEILLNKLAGNAAFGACRGKLGKNVSSIADEYIAETESPTSFLGKWDDFFGKARVMTNLLAQFKRDGLEVAYKELSAAMKSNSHFFPGETVPIEQTRPVTVLMLEPKKTFAFLRWLLEEHWATLRSYLSWKDGDAEDRVLGGKVRNPSVLTSQLYKTFPSLERLARLYHDGYEGSELTGAYQKDVIETFPQKVLNKGKAGKLAHCQWNDHIEYVGELRLIYVFEMDQAAVLKMFSRADQKRVATWQFNLPKIVETRSIGLHPQSMHDGLIKAKPALTSCGMAESWGAIALQYVPADTQFDSYPVAHYSHGVAGKYGIVFQAI